MSSRMFDLPQVPRGFRRYSAAAGAAAASAAGYIAKRAVYDAASKIVKGSGRKSKNISGEVTQLKREVRRLKTKTSICDSMDAQLVYKNRQVDACIASANQSCHSEKAGVNQSLIETVLGQLRYYDPSTPGTYITADYSTGTQSKEIMLSAYSKCLVRNNYQVPAHITVYVCTPKTDTSIAPITAMTNGFTDIGVSSANTNLQAYITESPQFQDLWKVASSTKKTIQPGQTCSVSHSVKKMKYDPSLNDSHPQSYQKKSGAHVYVIRVEGEVAHDTTADQQGFSGVGVDIVVDTKFTVHYDGGAAINYMVLATDASAFTNGAVLSNKPVSDNQGYSLA